MRINFLILTFTLFTITLCAQVDRFEHVTNRMNSPFGVYVDQAANSWVTETGTGNNDGRILLVRPNGRKDEIVVGLPSRLDNRGEVLGAWHTLPISKHEIAVVIGEGPAPMFGRILVFSLRKFQPGIDEPYSIDEAIESVDVSTFVKAQAGVVNSNPYSIALDKKGNWYVTDAGSNMVIQITKKRKHSVFAKFPQLENPLPFGPPMIDAVPTKIVPGSRGNFFIATLTGFPFPDTTARIYKLDRLGRLTTHASGLSRLTDIHYDVSSQEIHALEFGQFSLQPSPGWQPNTAKISKVSKDGKTITTVVEKLSRSGGITIDKWGSLYLTDLDNGKLLKMYKEEPAPWRVENTNEPAIDLEVKPTKATTFNAYPNPASQFLTVEWENEQGDTPVNLRLVDVAGRVVIVQQNQGNINTQQLDLQALQSGVYFLQIHTNDKITTKKIVVRK